MNDWDRVEGALRADEHRSRTTIDQAWRWTAGARKWLDAQGLLAVDLRPGDLARCLNEVPADGVRDRDKRVWALRVLVEAARTMGEPIARKPGSAAAVLDRIPQRSPLGKAVTNVMAGATTAGDRARFATTLGTFLRWYGSRDLKATDLWEGDLARYRRDLVDQGRRSPGEYLRVARRLLVELGLAAPRV